MWTRAELKSKAKEAFKANYWVSVLVGVIMMVISAAQGSGRSIGSGDDASISDAISNGASAAGLSNAVFMAIVGSIVGVGVIISIAIAIFVKNVLIVGCNNFFIKVAQYDEDAKVGAVVHGFKSNYMNVVLAMFMKDLFTTLWSLLFVVPGIIKAYEYRMVPYIVADDPDIEWKEAFAKSKEMMMGNKWATFVLDLSFLGWHFLGIWTCAILEIFWIMPYQATTDAELYLELKNNQ